MENSEIVGRIVGSIARVSIVRALAPLNINEDALRWIGPVLNQKIRQMPLAVRAVVYVSTYLFDWWGLFYGRRRFSVQDMGQQQRMFEAVEQCRWQPAKLFVRFYRKFPLYIYYALLEVSSDG